MRRLRKHFKAILFFVAILVAAQLGASALVRTGRVRSSIISHLRKSFGRPVEVGAFSAQLLPVPQLDVDGVSVAEDPAFGNEYFLRAERMSVNLRWWGLLRGHFEFGTISLTRPSLILVRNSAGRWNLEGWLPPSKESSPFAGAYGPHPPAEATHLLERIEFDEGRINFKFADQKLPFAFTSVSGSVQQVSPGRWQLRLEAQPWRSGVILQSAGRLLVRGDVAGTTSRLQPAQVHVHWDRASLADLFRLVSDNDYGVRGEFALDADASIGKPGAAPAPPGAWRFDVQARALGIHRWDLTERRDNPRANLRIRGLWALAAGQGLAEEWTLELPLSRLQGTAALRLVPAPDWHVQLTSAEVQSQDILAWCRAFRTGIAEDLAWEESFRAHASLSSPLRFEDASLSSPGGIIRASGFAAPIRVSPFTGSLKGSTLTTDPIQLSLTTPRAEPSPAPAATKPPEKKRDLVEDRDSLALVFSHDTSLGSGSLRIDARLDRAEDFLRLSSAFGRTLNHGWELSGAASSSMAWVWENGFLRNTRWDGSVDLGKAELQVAGLNLPVQIDDARIEWKKGQRNATIRKAEAFGTSWSGTVSRGPVIPDAELPTWDFRLHADQIDATELDRWVGPRSRPNWLQRLLPSLMSGTGSDAARPSELLRRVSAEGDLSADTLVFEKVKLTRAHARVAFRDLKLEVRDAEAQWAGGAVKGAGHATFSAFPSYEFSGSVDRANLAHLPWSPKWAERWSGTASATLHLTTEGVGREDLLRRLAGRGEFTFKNVEFRGWDIPASLDSGAPRTGSTRWSLVAGEFFLRDRQFTLDAIRLDGPRGRALASGAFGFDQSASLSVSQHSADKHPPSPPRRFQLNGALDAPQVSVVGGERLKK